MSKKLSDDFFWPSYVDVMTNLFAITLVLFVVSFILFKGKNAELERANAELNVIKEEYDRVQAMNNAIQSWDNNPYFKYDTKYQKHILTLPFEYNLNEYEIPNGLSNPQVENDIKRVGKSIIQTIHELMNKYVKTKDGKQNFNIKFLVVIEGQASKSGEEEHNDVLSYRRALYLKKYWLNPNNQVSYNGMNFLDKRINCELIVSGSGFSGSPREPDFIDGEVNPANQRFLVHILPVIDWNIKNNL